MPAVRGHGLVQVTEIGAQPSPFLVVDVDTRPEFYKSTPQGGYVEVPQDHVNSETTGGKGGRGAARVWEAAHGEAAEDIIGGE